MDKEELEKEAEGCMHNALFWLKLPISKENVEQGGSYILKLLEPREKRIAELEKENAELKEKVKALIIHDTNAVLSGLELKVLKESHRDRANKTQEQLTKAKELIKTLLLIADNRVSQMEFQLCVADAKQFLKDKEKSEVQRRELSFNHQAQNYVGE
jgi:hypothetical protein